MNPYSVLGLQPGASPDEIKTAYRKLASRHHPDKGGDTARFQEIQAAYEQLTNPKQQPGQPPGGPDGFHFNFRGFDPFEQFFGFRQQQRARIYTTVVNLTLEQVARGGEETTRIVTPEGAHVVRMNIPPGVETGQQFRYDGIIPDIPVMVTFNVLPHDRFQRQGLDVQLEHKMNVFDLILGREITIQDVHGAELAIAVRPLTQPGSRLRLPGRGIRAVGKTGDFYVLITGTIPDKIPGEIIKVLNRHQPNNFTGE